MKAVLPLLFLALGSCSDASDPYAPRAGLYEVSGGFVDLKGPHVTAEQLAKLRKAVPRPSMTRECFDGVAEKVGDVKMDGRCKVTRVSDKGAVADNEWQCEGRGGGGPVTITTHGTRGPDRYDYRISSASTERGDTEPTVVITRETGRRVGECPAQP